MSAPAAVWKWGGEVLPPHTSGSVEQNFHIQPLSFYFPFLFSFLIASYSFTLSQAHGLYFRADFLSLNRTFELWVVAHIKFWLLTFNSVLLLVFSVLLLWMSKFLLPPPSTLLNMKCKFETKLIMGFLYIFFYMCGILYRFICGFIRFQSYWSALPGEYLKFSVYFEVQLVSSVTYISYTKGVEL